MNEKDLDDLIAWAERLIDNRQADIDELKQIARIAKVQRAIERGRRRRYLYPLGVWPAVLGAGLLAKDIATSSTAKVAALGAGSALAVTGAGAFAVTELHHPQAEQHPAVAAAPPAVTSAPPSTPGHARPHRSTPPPTVSTAPKPRRRRPPAPRPGKTASQPPLLPPVSELPVPPIDTIPSPHKRSCLVTLPSGVRIQVLRLVCPG